MTTLPSKSGEPESKGVVHVLLFNTFTDDLNRDGHTHHQPSFPHALALAVSSADCTD